MAIRKNGPVTKATRKNLVDGVRGAPMPEAVVDQVLAQAAEFAGLLVDAYEENVATGEVGRNGSGIASDESIIGERPVTGLMYGRVQSGKTVAMVLATSLALDNGFRVVIVLTADNVDLVKQTADRFMDIEGPVVYSTLKGDEGGPWRLPEWESAEQDFLDDIAENGLVFICAKNAFHLPDVIAFLARVDAAAMPAIVFDDEADAATPDHTLNARTSGRDNAPQYPSTINRRIVENNLPGEEGDSALESLPHSVFIQVTATPYVLILQRADSTLFPKIRYLLEPGEGYCGGEVFFGAFDPSAKTPAPPLVLVPDRESLTFNRRPIPEGLSDSINFALVSAAALVQSGTPWPSEGFKHLSHTSHLNQQHDLVANHIVKYLRQLKRDLKGGFASIKSKLAKAHTELQRSVTKLPTLDKLVAEISSAIQQAQVYKINMKSQRGSHGPRLNFLVGGNILGRGLTINNLLVTYYVRQAQVSQMDTVLQHARMYGYRKQLMPYTRVYLPRILAVRFQDIHLSEEALRGTLASGANDETVPLTVAWGTRPTRPGALDAEVRVFANSMNQISPYYPIDDDEIVGSVNDILADANVTVGAKKMKDRFTRVPLNIIRDLVKLLEPKDEDLGRWYPKDALALIDVFEAKYNGTGIIYVRGFDADPTESERTRSRLQGQSEIPAIREQAGDVPALALLYWKDPGQPIVWYPTLVLPKDMPLVVLNPE